jgi:hypothetical protein
MELARPSDKFTKTDIYGVKSLRLGGIILESTCPGRAITAERRALKRVDVPSRIATIGTVARREVRQWAKYGSVKSNTYVGPIA